MWKWEMREVGSRNAEFGKQNDSISDPKPSTIYFQSYTLDLRPIIVCCAPVRASSILTPETLYQPPISYCCSPYWVGSIEYPASSIEYPVSSIQDPVNI